MTYTKREKRSYKRGVARGLMTVGYYLSKDGKKLRRDSVNLRFGRKRR